MQREKGLDLSSTRSVKQTNDNVITTTTMIVGHHQCRSLYDNEHPV